MFYTWSGVFRAYKSKLKLNVNTKIEEIFQPFNVNIICFFKNPDMTLCKVMWGDHSQSVTKNLTPYRFNFFEWGLDGQITEIHSFPTMYIIGGGKWGRNGSKLRFSQKKWPKNSFFEGHKSGSTDFGGVWHPYFWRYRYFPHVFWKNGSIIFEMSYVQGVNLR